MSRYQNGFLRWWHAQSIEKTLPFTFTLLLALLVTFYVFAAFRAVKQSAIETTGQHVEGVSRELGKLLITQNQQRAANMQKIVSSPAFRSAVADGSVPDADALLETVVQSRDSSAILLMTLNMRPIAQAGNAASARAMEELARPVRDALEQKGTLRRSRFFVDGDKAFYWNVITVGDSTGEMGLLAQLRRIGNNDQNSSDALKQIMGGARVYFANVEGSGDTWVDLDGTVATSPLTRGTLGPRRTHLRDDGSYLAHSTVIPGTPWRIVTESSLADSHIQGVEFLRDTAPFAAAVILIGALLAWLLARRYAQPMRVLANAAQGIAAGDYAQRVAIRRKDELGRLGDAFNQMAREVELSDTEVRRMNADLEDRVRHRTHELEAANHELRAFSYSVSHDLRSPLRSMDGFSQALLEDYGDKLDSTGKDYLQRVRNAAQRMGLLIDDLLQLSRVTLHPVVLEDVDVTNLAREVVGDLYQGEPDRVIAVSVEKDLHAQADRGLLRVALQNLLSNAWKFTSGVEGARIEVGAVESNGAVEYFVRDNGAGFDMQYADKLFIPFQRLHSEREFKGSGIGLATVQRVVSRHGGTVRAEATVGKGATFYFSLGGDE